MDVIVLIHDLEWTEKKIYEILRSEGYVVEYADIRDISSRSILTKNPKLVLNRVYASVGNRDYLILDKNINLICELRKAGINVINSYAATLSDYSKYHAYQLMAAACIPTPRTILFEDKTALNEIIPFLGGFPIIVKRDTGGRGVDLKKCSSLAEVADAIAKIHSSNDYKGGIILQEFVESSRAYDYRVCVVGNRLAYVHGRTLISTDGERAWLASASLGSTNIPIKKVSEKLKDIALTTSKTLEADLNTLDIIETKAGFVVIENNLTPQLSEEWEKQLGFSPTEKFVRLVIDSSLGPLL